MSLKILLKNFFRVLPGLAVLPYAVLLCPSAPFHRMMLKEDGIFESGSALCWLFSAAVFFYLYLKDRRGCDLIFVKSGRNVFLLLWPVCFSSGLVKRSAGGSVFSVCQRRSC